MATLTGCSKPQRAAQTETPKNAVREAGPMTVFGPGVYPIEKCGRSVPAPAGQPYIVTLKPNFALRDAQGEMSGHPHGNNPNPNPHPAKTRLDIVTTLKDGEAAVVRIVLADPLLAFQQKPYALRGGDPNAPLIFCDPVYVTGGRQLSFTVHRYTGGPTYASYNLGLIVTDENDSAYQLPIFIDPGVDNDGIDSR
jgi:hypothetical protein